MKSDENPEANIPRVKSQLSCQASALFHAFANECPLPDDDAEAGDNQNEEKEPKEVKEIKDKTGEKASD